MAHPARWDPQRATANSIMNHASMPRFGALSGAGSARREVCLDENTVAAYLAGNLGSVGCAAIERHIDRCEPCRRHLSCMVECEVDSATLLPVSSSGDPVRPRATPSRAITAGTRVGRYVVETIVGAGAMGVVYRAFDPELRRPLA